MGSEFTIDRRNKGDRRRLEPPPSFPFFDNDRTLVREDRRRIPDRRINNIKIENRDDASQIEAARLFLWHKEDIRELTMDAPAVVVGRSPSCDLILSNRYVSRLHAKFEFVGNEFIITDHSTNGTYIKNDDGEVFLNGRKISAKRQWYC